MAARSGGLLRPIDGFEVASDSTTDEEWLTRNLINNCILFSLDEHIPRALKRLNTEATASTALPGVEPADGGPSMGEEVDVDLLDRLPDGEEALFEASRDYFYWRFFSGKHRIYLPRRELSRQLAKTSKTDSYIVLSGSRGVGKSTMLRDLCRDLGGDDGTIDQSVITPSPGSCLIYVDLKRNEGILEDPSLGDHRVCRIIYERMRSRYLARGFRNKLTGEVRASVREVQTAWQDYRLQKAPAYAELLDQVDSWDDEQVDLLMAAKRDFSDQWKEAERAFADQPSNTKLQLFLEFLHDRFNHGPVVVIDNIDRYTTVLHERLDDTVNDLASSPDNSARFILAMRTSTAASIFERAWERRNSKLQRIRIPTIERNIQNALTHEANWKDDEFDFDEGSAPVEQQLSEPFFTGVVVRRFRALQDFVGGLATGVWDATPSEVDLRFAFVEDDAERKRLAAAAPNLEDVRSLAQMTQRLMTEHRSNAELKYAFQTSLLRWHNYSLRSALAHQFRIYSSIVTGRDALFPPGDGDSATRYTAPTKHDYRSLMWRHMILGASPTVYDPSGAIPDMVSEVSGRRLKLNAPRVRLLQYLSHHGEVELGAIRRAFKEFGIRGEDVNADLDLLLDGRGFESEGLIRVDGAVRTAERNVTAAELRDERLVKIRPAGLYFLQSIVHSCEYLFWCAMYSSDQRAIAAVNDAAGQHEKVASLIAVDWFRALVAVGYLNNVVLESERTFLREVAGGDSASARELRAKVGRLTSCTEWHRGWSLSQRCYSSINGFINHAAPEQMPPEQHERIKKLITHGKGRLDDAMVGSGLTLR